MAATAEHKSANDLLIKLIKDKIHELEKKGVLPMGKKRGQEKSLAAEAEGKTMHLTSI